MAVLAALLVAFALACCGQEAQPAQQPPGTPVPPGGQVPHGKEASPPPKTEPARRWNVFWQSTVIGQYHGTFHSPYQGPNSLENVLETSGSLTSTLFLGYRLADNTQIYVDPELAGGRGFSNVTGIANFPNGELPRVSGATPKPYLARAYIQHDFGWGSERRIIRQRGESTRRRPPVNRYTVVVGRFTVTDFFDNNRYSHDPRTQFMGWAVMYNGAWDYPADTRGYTWGWYHELHTKNWSWRYASAFEPKVANGEALRSQNSSRSRRHV